MKLNLLAVVPVTRTFFGKEYHARVPLMSLRFDRHITHVRKDLAYGEWSLALRWPFYFQLQIHLTRYEMGASLEKHKDTITRGERQFRLLIVLKEALRGGELICPTYIFNFRRLRLFEPCSHEHEVTLVEEGERLVILAGIRYGRFVLSPPF